MPTLGCLYDQQGQSAWLDNLTRPYLQDGTLVRLVSRGIRGVTANPTIIAKAIEASHAYDRQFQRLVRAGRTVEDAYWHLVITDVLDALRILRPTFDSSHGVDGFVSLEVAPSLAGDTEATKNAARDLHDHIDEPNLMVKIPATIAGIPAIEALIAEGRSINVTLVFSLVRYSQVLEAYLSGLETLARRGDDLSAVRSVASFFVSRVDSEVDKRLEEIGTDEALALRGRAAVTQAKLAYQLFHDTHTGERWERLAERGARPQRLLWASTSTKNPHYPDTLYVDSLIGPDTINTLAESTMNAFEDHGTLARTIDADVPRTEEVMNAIMRAGVDMEDVGHTLETEGLDAFQASLNHVLGTLDTKTHDFAGS
jgi:transaldolase